MSILIISSITVEGVLFYFFVAYAYISLNKIENFFSVWRIVDLLCDLPPTVIFLLGRFLSCYFIKTLYILRN